MVRRIAALALWTYFAWYLGALVAVSTGLPSAIGPLLGAGMAAYILLTWRRPLVRSARSAEATASR